MDFWHHNKSLKSQLRTFVGNQTTNVPFWPVKGGGSPKGDNVLFFYRFFLKESFPREGCKKIHMKSLVLCQTGGEGGDDHEPFFFKCNELVRVHRWYQILAYFGQMLTDKTEARVANIKIFRWDQV